MKKIDFEPDPIEEADRGARLAHERSHLKKRNINGYNAFERLKDNEAIWADEVRWINHKDKVRQRSITNGDYDFYDDEYVDE